MKLDKFHIHEAMDRTHCVQGIIDSLLLEHTAVAQNPKISKQIVKAQKHLSNAYQLIGGLSSESD